MRTIRIGSGAGYSGDRIEPALALMEQGDIQYIIFVPICVLRDHFKLGEGGQRTETLRVGFQLVDAITHLAYDLIK